MSYFHIVNHFENIYNFFSYRQNTSVHKENMSYFHIVNHFENIYNFFSYRQNTSVHKVFYYN